ncbi:MAG TPA: hypothetical protein VFK02_01140, partial [Kofleriaceae bacterium]|nr:hypothetical protein [Kofleriaceae bacterium]
TVAAEIGFGDRNGLAAAAREAWRTVQSATLREPPRVLGEIRRGRELTGCRLCRNPLLWTGVGAAVIATVIVIAVTSSSRPPPVVGINGSDFGR